MSDGSGPSQRGAEPRTCLGDLRSLAVSTVGVGAVPVGGGLVVVAVGADIGWVGRPFTSGWRPASS